MRTWMVWSLGIYFAVAGTVWAQRSDGARAAGAVPATGAPEASASTPAAEMADVLEDVISSHDPFEKAFPRGIVPEAVDTGGSLGMGGGSVVHKEFDPSRYNVTGIVWGIEQSRAIINGQILGVGGVIEDATIKKIDKEGILLEYDGQEVLLKRNMGAENEKKT